MDKKVEDRNRLGVIHLSRDVFTNFYSPGVVFVHPLSKIIGIFLYKKKRSNEIL